MDVGTLGVDQAGRGATCSRPAVTCSTCCSQEGMKCITNSSSAAVTIWVGVKRPRMDWSSLGSPTRRDVRHCTGLGEQASVPQIPIQSW